MLARVIVRSMNAGRFWMRREMRVSHYSGTRRPKKPDATKRSSHGQEAQMETVSVHPLRLCVRLTSGVIGLRLWSPVQWPALPRRGTAPGIVRRRSASCGRVRR